MNEFQHTLKQPAELEGIGLHTGQSVKVRICPSEANTELSSTESIWRAISGLRRMLIMCHRLNGVQH